MGLLFLPVKIRRGIPLFKYDKTIPDYHYNFNKKQEKTCIVPSLRTITKQADITK
jgi:hypothetical protein